MRILFVSMVAFENNSSATIQNKGIIRGLWGLGHEIDSITLRPNKEAINYDSSMNDIGKMIKNAYYIDINPRYAMLMTKKNDIKKFTYSNSDKGILKNILKKGKKNIKSIYNNISIFDSQKVNVKGVSKIHVDYSKYDIIISASDPKSSHLIVERIYNENKNLNAKWIQYWGDPMFNDITRNSDWRDGLVKYYENRLISKSHRIIYASPFTLETQKETFIKSSFKMDYASQVYVGVKDKKCSVGKSIQNNSFSIGYFGAYYSKIRNIIPLYNVARNNKLKLNICGASDIKLQSIDNVLVKEMVSYKKAIELEEESDILVCICNIKGTQIPGKIYYCTSYEKPIIVILDGEYKEKLKSYLESFNRFILCENEEQSIKDAIDKAKEQINKSEYKIVEQLTPEYMANKILGNI